MSKALNAWRDADAIIRSRRSLPCFSHVAAKPDCEGGCGVIGIISDASLPGSLIIRPCEQMQNRGNAKGGGVAAAGLFGDLREHYALQVAYLESGVRGDVEKEFIEPCFTVAHQERQPSLDDHRALGLEVKPPEVFRYFVRVKTEVLEDFAASQQIQERDAAEDEFVFQNSFRLNRRHYAGLEHPSAFVLSHGRDLMVLKGVGFAEQIARYYRLDEQTAHVWIGHQRYPTRGRVWHPGGAHPFVGLHEALVHNGDFANYHAVTEYLFQRGISTLFVTDTEVSVLLFDFYSRVLRYPLEFVIEALGPTPEGDFERLSKRRQRIYRALQTAHLHGSPDGPWFFIVARAEPGTLAPQLIGITDVSMLRPQVFALQTGEKSFGAIASEKQAIDAFFEDVSKLWPEVPAVADRTWVARGGSCTDGGAFTYSLRTENGRVMLDVRDKFGNSIMANDSGLPASRRLVPEVLQRTLVPSPERLESGSCRDTTLSPEITEEVQSIVSIPPAEVEALRKLLLQADHQSLSEAVDKILLEPGGFEKALEALAFLRDRPFRTGMRRSTLLSTLDREIERLLDAVPAADAKANQSAVRVDHCLGREQELAPAPSADAVLIVDARKFPPEGRNCVSRLLVAAYRKGFRRFIIYRCHGDRFLGCGLGSKTDDVRIDVFGSSGDYLGSGMDGAEIYVHGDAQDQVGQILNSGRIVVFGSVGQTLLYGAKGGEAFIMGSAAGRPLINAVGKIRAVINGTCLDYCAESFMAGEQLDGGFVIINGLRYDERGEVIGLDLKYPGNNLFSLASGGACYLNDPYRTVGENQLNGASFVDFRQADWNVILPFLRKNDELFGISIRNDLLTVDGVLKWPKEVFRKVVASKETEKLDWSSLPA
jgi:glutamate synthase domain-containing protein 1/glutamate synthase domain-containing protein 3